MRFSDPGAAAVALPGAELRLEPRTRLVASSLAGVLSAAALVRYGLEPRGLIAALLLGALVVLSAYDIQYKVLPNRILLPAVAIVLAAQVAFFPDRSLEWIGAAAGTALFFLIPTFINPRAVGMGDVKLGLLLGAGLGRDVIGALVMGSLAAFVVALWLLARHRGAARGTVIPLGPFLSFGAAAALLLA